jgi:RNA binding exosome subunit
MPMTPTEEIRAIRHMLAAQFDNDLDRIVADLQRQQQESGREYIRLPKRTPRQQRTTNHRLQPSGGSGRS